MCVFCIRVEYQQFNVLVLIMWTGPERGSCSTIFLVEHLTKYNINVDK